MSNPFEALADQQLSSAAKAKHRASEKRLAKLVVKSERDAPMVASQAEKAMFEANAQFREYQKWRRQCRAELFSGEYADRLSELGSMLKCLTPESAPALVDWVEYADWLQQADYKTRMGTLSVIADEIARFRVRRGMPPFDDSLPGEHPTAFEQIRYILTGVGSWAGGATP